MSIVLLEMSPVLGTKNVKIVRIIMKSEGILSHGSDASFETIYEVDSASLTGVISCSAQVSKIASHRQNPILVFFTSQMTIFLDQRNLKIVKIPHKATDEDM